MNLNGLRIVLVGPLPPPMGGMATQTETLAQKLQAEGASVRVVRTNRTSTPACLERVRYLRAVFRLLPYVGELLAALRQADLVHVMANSGWSWYLYAVPAIRVAHWYRRPVVVNYRGGEAADFFAASWRRIEPTMRHATSIIVPSGFLAGLFARYGMDARVVPNVLDATLFRPSGSADAKSSALRILIARNLEAIYGIDLALRALSRIKQQVPTVEMVVTGSGPERATLEQMAAELGLEQHLRFTGKVDRGEMARLFHTADVLVNPSRVDNSPNAVIEALACGVPIVATRVGGVPFLVEHEKTALLVESEDSDALAAAVLRLSQTPALAERLARNGIECARRFAWPAVFAELAGIYGDALRAPAG